MIARYGHFLALNWNAGEENAQTAPQEIAAVAKIAELDPYHHLRVSHSYLGRKVRHFPLLGERSAVNGISMQGQFADFSDVRPEIAEWALRSSAAGRPCVIASDEQGGGDAGIPVDADHPIGKLTGPPKFDDDRRAVRGQVLWATLTGGGYGVDVVTVMLAAAATCCARTTARVRPSGPTRRSRWTSFVSTSATTCLRWNRSIPSQEPASHSGSASRARR
jgi:hypothetical protein